METSHDLVDIEHTLTCIVYEFNQYDMHVLNELLLLRDDIHPSPGSKNSKTS